MKQYLYLPPQYDLVVGDTFELFYHGLVNFLTIEGCDFELFYEDGKNRGKGFSRKYIFTPTEQDVGTHSLHVRLWSNEGEILEEKTTNISITMPPKSPSSECVILLIGASDAGPGVWPAEVGRRLIGIGGTPEGYGLENVSFIGSRERDGIRYEGYGGWSFTSYTTGNDNRNDFMIISGDFSDKNATMDQHSTYRSENGFVWKLETISQKEIKIICTAGMGRLPSMDGGRLVHESGGENTADIVYTAARHTNANPFWSSEKGRNDFKAYARRFGKERINEIVVTLTWNSHSLSAEEYKEIASRFIASVHADFPECHITLLSGIYPARDGFAQNYGISWPWFPKISKMRAFDEVKASLASEDPAHLSFVHISSQYDVDYNCVSSEFEANTRNAAQVRTASNGIHITDMGSKQVADAIVRRLCARFSENN